MYLTNLNLKFKPVNKDRLFYDHYQYCLGFYLREASCLRDLNHEHIDIIIERRRQWRQMSLGKWHIGGTRNILAQKTREINDDIVVNLHTLTDVLLTSGIDFKLVTSVSTAWIYTNDLSLLKTVDSLDFLQEKTYTEAVITRPKDTICLSNPKHTNRAYFGSHKLTPMEKTNLKNFFDNQLGYIRTSPSLDDFFGLSFYRTQDYYFFDYTGDSWLVMLNLIRPGLVRKTLTIIPR